MVSVLHKELEYKVEKFKKKNPLISLGSLFISSPFEGGIIGRGALFNLEKTMVSVLHKELEYKVEKFKKKKVGGHAAENQHKNPNFQLLNKPSLISPHKV